MSKVKQARSRYYLLHIAICGLIALYSTTAQTAQHSTKKYMPAETSFPDHARRQAPALHGPAADAASKTAQDHGQKPQARVAAMIPTQRRHRPANPLPKAVFASVAIPFNALPAAAGWRRVHAAVDGLDRVLVLDRVLARVARVAGQNLAPIASQPPAMVGAGR